MTGAPLRLPWAAARAAALELASRPDARFTAIGARTALVAGGKTTPATGDAPATEEVPGATLLVPVLFPPPDPGEHPAAWAARLPEHAPPHLLVLVRAGNAALVLCRDGAVVRHATVGKYMVRKKRGFAQLTYLKRKGKSRAGSRIRLREGTEFFEEINARLGDWAEDIAGCARLFTGCPVRLAAEWRASRVAPPFAWDDPRLEGVPLTVGRPTFAEARRIAWLLAAGTLETGAQDRGSPGRAGSAPD